MKTIDDFGIVLFRVVSVFAGFVCLFPAHATASFQGLGDLPGGDFFSVARSVSADGSTVVGESISASGIEAFRWTFAGGMAGLGDLPGGIFESIAQGVSEDGSVVVGASRSDPYYEYWEAFRWVDLNNNDLVDADERLDVRPEFALGDLPGGAFISAAADISHDGSVIAGQGHSDSGFEAFRWVDLNGNNVVDANERLDHPGNHGMFGLGDLPGGSFLSAGYGISADGSFLTGQGESVSGNEAFHWVDLNANGLVDENEKLELHPEFALGDLPGGMFNSLAWGISSDGSTVVGYSYSGTHHEAFRWTNEGGMVGLNPIPGEHSVAWDASADGSVVVGSVGGHAFIWDQTNGIRDLRDVLVTDYGLDLTGWALGHAMGISDDGLTIVGYGTNPSGQMEGWIATIPPPTPAEQIQEILDFVDDSIIAGILVGVGPGKSADNRLKVVVNMLEEVQSLIEAELFSEACIQLQDVYKKCDGQSPPPDTITGSATIELAERIESLLDSLSCLSAPDLGFTDS
ncbi:MAG: hypothetical protein ACFFCW_00980 [Candidatus Hodarchaeota archaeon]